MTGSNSPLQASLVSAQSSTLQRHSLRFWRCISDTSSGKIAAVTH